MAKSSSDVDTDAIERLLAELEEDPEAGLKTKRHPRAATAATTTGLTGAALATSDAAALRPWEYNPYADTAQQDQLQNLVDLDALMGRSPSKAAPTSASDRSTAAADSAVPSVASLAPARLPPMSSVAAAESPSHRAPPVSVHEEAAAIIRSQTGPEASPDDYPTESAGVMAGGIHPQLEIHAVRPALGSLNPPTRCDHSAVAIDGQCILFGGSKLNAATGQQAPVSDCTCYDASSGGFEPVFAARGDAPSARSQHAASAVDIAATGVPRHMIVVGGRDASGEPLGDAHIFSFADQQWEPVSTSGRDLPARFGHSAVAVGPRVFVFGGKGVKSAKNATDDATPTKDGASGKSGSLHLSSDMYALDVNKSTWHKVTGKQSGGNNKSSAESVLEHNHPVKRFMHASCASADGTAVFVHGGVTSGSQYLDDLWKYDIATRTWLEIRRGGGIPRSRHSLLYVDDSLVCVGGAHGDGVGSSAFVSSLSAASPTWMPHQLVGHPLPRPTRAGHAAAMLNGVLFIHGGVSPAETPDALSSLLAVTLSSALVPVSDPVPLGLAAPMVGVAALEAGLRHHTCPFDLAIDAGTGEYVGCNAGILAMRAPALFEALAVLPSETVATAMGNVPSQYGERARVVRIMPSRHRDGLAHPLSLKALEAIVCFVYAAELPTTTGDENAETLLAFCESELLPAAKAYRMDHLEQAIQRFVTAGPDAPKPSVRRLEAQLVARERLQASLATLVDDGLSTDCELLLRNAADSDDAPEAIRFHSFLVAGRSEPLRRVLHGLLGGNRGHVQNPDVPASAERSFTDRRSGLTARWRHSALQSGSDTIVVSIADAQSGRRLPSLKSALLAAFTHMYTGGVDTVVEDNAVEVLAAARILDLPQLAATAERVIVAHVDEATAWDAAETLSPSELVALLQMGDSQAAEHVTSRVTVAAAKIFDNVRKEPSFAQLPPHLQAYVQTVASQCGWKP